MSLCLKYIQFQSSKEISLHHVKIWSTQDSDYL